MNRAWVSNIRENTLGGNPSESQAGHPQGQSMLYFLYLSDRGLGNP